MKQKEDERLKIIEETKEEFEKKHRKNKIKKLRKCLNLLKNKQKQKLLKINLV